jgi:hypothetical protein
MKQVFAIVLGGLVVFNAGTSAQQPDPAEEKRVVATMEIQAQATIKKDLVVLDKIYHDDLMWTRSSGIELTKPDVLKEMAGPGNRDGIEFKNTTIRIYGSVALFKGITEIRRGSGDSMRMERLNILWVLLKDPRGPQGWQIHNRQTIALPAQGR